MSLPDDLSRLAALVDIVAKLRSPDGCPWDKEQTHASLREDLLEECYEVLEVLDEGNSDKLCGELGDVVRGINTKLIHRHPHVFGSKKVKNTEEVLLNWEQLKREERGADTSILASVPKQMPALGYSQEIQRRVARAGFDWEEIDGVIDKLTEEIGEFKQADSRERKAEEFGDLLFTLANIARRLGIDSEVSLREANRRFYRRFTDMEEVCRQRGVNFAELSFAEQNVLWEEAKQKSKG